MCEKKLRVGLVVDNPKRDLKGLLLIARSLVHKGQFSVFLIPMYQQKTDVPVLKLDILIINYARKNNRAFISNCVDRGIKVFVLDTEGGILSTDAIDSPENWAKLFYDTGFPKLISGYFFWGKATYDAFKNYSGLAGNKLFLTGCPRYDQSHSKWKHMLNSKYSKHVLINSNFSAINPLFNGSLGKEKQAFLSVGWSEDYVDALLLELIKAQAQIISEICYVAESLPNELFVFRPHPFESEKIYRKAYILNCNL